MSEKKDTTVVGLNEIAVATAATTAAATVVDPVPNSLQEQNLRRRSNSSQSNPDNNSNNSNNKETDSYDSRGHVQGWVQRRCRFQVLLCKQRFAEKLEADGFSQPPPSRTYRSTSAEIIAYCVGYTGQPAISHVRCDSWLVNKTFPN